MEAKLLTEVFSADKYCFNYGSFVIIFYIHHNIFITRYFGGERHVKSTLVNDTAHVLSA